MAQTILLAAADAGLGGIMIGNCRPDQIREALELPEHLVPMLILAIGKPDETIVLTEAENVLQKNNRTFWISGNLLI